MANYPGYKYWPRKRVKSGMTSGKSGDQNGGSSSRGSATSTAAFSSTKLALKKGSTAEVSPSALIKPQPKLSLRSGASKGSPPFLPSKQQLAALRLPEHHLLYKPHTTSLGSSSPSSGKHRPRKKAKRL